jgi:hypothetical protein
VKLINHAGLIQQAVIALAAAAAEDVQAPFLTAYLMCAYMSGRDPEVRYAEFDGLPQTLGRAVNTAYQLGTVSRRLRLRPDGRLVLLDDAGTVTVVSHRSLVDSKLLRSVG